MTKNKNIVAQIFIIATAIVYAKYSTNTYVKTININVNVDCNLLKDFTIDNSTSIINHINHKEK